MHLANHRRSGCAALLVACAIAACGDDDGSSADMGVVADTAPRGDAEGDALEGLDARSIADTSLDDAGARDDATTESDAGPSSACGDGTLDADEICDGTPAPCTELGATWTSGVASCRDDCSGYDVASCTRTRVGTFEMVQPALRDSRWAGARCNDGTPFGFAIRLAPSPSADWIVHLGGGAYCDDSSMSCTERRASSPELTTGPMAADRNVGTPPFGGVLSDDPTINPDFAAANQVFAFYCSSDFWAGATIERLPTAADAEGWYFAGRANVGAMLEILVERYGLDDASPETRVLWGGGSAGAHGAHFNAARIRGVLPRTSAAGRLKLFADAGWMIDFDDPAHRIGLARTTDREVWTAALAFWGATLDPDCVAASPDPIDCWFGPGWYPHVARTMPVLVQQSEIDASFMGIHGLEASDPADESAVDAWRAQSIESFVDVEWLFSGRRPYHVLGGTDEGLAIGLPGAPLRDVLGRFWAGDAPERVTF